MRGMRDMRRQRYQSLLVSYHILLNNRQMTVKLFKDSVPCILKIYIINFIIIFYHTLEPSTSNPNSNPNPYPYMYPNPYTNLSMCCQKMIPFDLSQILSPAVALLVQRREAVGGLKKLMEGLTAPVEVFPPHIRYSPPRIKYPPLV